MDIFSNIFLKHNKYTKNIILEHFLDNIHNYDNTLLLLHIYNFISATIFHKKNNYTRETDYRINYFDYYILQNDNINDEDKNYLFDIFSKSQKSYISLNKFAFEYKKKHAKIYDIEYDLCTNHFSNIKSNILFDLFCKNDKVLYKFRISDIINIINNSLCYHDNFISIPQSIKNPYTNTPFNKGELYYIYTIIKKSTFFVPILLERFMKSDFNLVDFKLDNECFLREESIKNFIKNDDEILKKKQYILDMLDTYSNDIKIDFFFPANILIKHFNRPYLQLYLSTLYSLNPEKKSASIYILIEKLAKFHRLNRNYGRPYITKKRDNLNNILYIYRYDTTINTESFNLFNNANNEYEQQQQEQQIEHQQQQGNEEHPQEQEYQEELEEQLEEEEEEQEQEMQQTYYEINNQSNIDNILEIIMEEIVRQRNLDNNSTSE